MLCQYLWLKISIGVSIGVFNIYKMSIGFSIGFFYTDLESIRFVLEAPACYYYFVSKSKY